MSEASGGESSVPVPKELASSVPSFDPATDNVEIWTSKVELLLATWPSTKLNELATRLILGCKGTAYQKLQLLRTEVLTNSDRGIQRLVEIVGGTWGQVPLEKKFEMAEKARHFSEVPKRLMKVLTVTCHGVMLFGLNCYPRKYPFRNSRHTLLSVVAS